MMLFSINTPALRHVNILRQILTINLNRLSVNKQFARKLSTSGKITIDGITKELKSPENREFVPLKFCK